MARLFPGGTSTDNLAAVISAYNSGPWTYFAWIRRDGGGGGGFGRVFHIDPTGATATDGQAIAEGVDINNSPPYATAKQPFATQPMEFGAFAFSGVWQLLVYTYDGSSQPPDDSGGTTNTQCALFVGNVTTPMAQVNADIADQTHYNGAGARVTGLTDLRIGNRGTLNRAWNGGIFCVGMVPYMMSLTDAEKLRNGDLSGLAAGTAPIFFFGLEGSGLTSYSTIGPSLTLTATGTSVIADPVTLSLAGGNITGTPATVATIAGTGAIGGGTTNVTGTPATVASFAGIGSVGPTGAAAPTIVNRAQVVNSNTITKPAGGQVGDFYVVGVYTESAAVPANVLLSGFTPTGYVTQVDATAGGLVATTNCFWRAYDGTEGSSFTVAGTGAFACITAMIVRGAGTPITHVNESVNSGGSLTLSGATTTKDNALGILISHSVTSPSQSSSGWTQLVAWDSGTAATYSRIYASAGATGSSTLTYAQGGSGSSMGGNILIFEPALVNITGTSATVASVAGIGLINAPYVFGTPTHANAGGVSVPSGAQTGDIYVFTRYTESDASPTTVANDGNGHSMTLMGIWGQAGHDGLDGNQWMTAWYRVYDGTQGNDFACPESGLCVAFIVRGADTSVAPIIGANNWYNGGTSSPVTITGITTVTANSLALVLAAIFSGATNPAIVGWDVVVLSDYFAGTHFSKVFGPTGATGSVSLSFPTPSGVSGVMIAFAPPSGGVASITGTSATVASVAGTGTVTGHATVTGTSTTVLSVAGTGTITSGAATDITGTSTTVIVNTRIGQIDIPAPDPVKISDRGKRTSTSTGNATLTITNPTLIAVGNYLIARVAVDNSGSSGARPGLTVSDARNGTWTHGTGGLQDPGTASAGIAVYLCYVKVTTPYQAADTISFAWTTGTPISAIVVEEWANINQTTPLAVAENQANNVSSTAQPAIARTPLAIKQLVYVAAALEGFSSYWGAQDSDALDGAWIDLTKDEGNTGTAATSVSVYGGAKVVTSTNAQTWNNTIGTTSDWAACAVVFAKRFLTTSIMGIPVEVNTDAGVGNIGIPTAVSGTSATVASVAGTGVVTGNAAIAGTPATVASIAGTGTVTGNASVVGTSATVAVVAGTGIISVQIIGTSATVASFAGTGVITATLTITGTSATVASFAGTGVITATQPITGVSATVASFAGTGVVSGHTAVTGISATVASFAGTGTLTATTAISGTSATVASFAGTGAVTGRASVIGTSATVASFAGTGTLTATTAITGTSATVSVTAGTGIISVQITGSSATVATFAGTGAITATQPITGTSATVIVNAGIGQILSGGDVFGISGTVYVNAGTGTITATTAITGTGGVVAVAAGSGVIGVTSSIIGTSATVAVNAGTGIITGQTNITGTTTIVNIFAGTGSITGNASITGTSGVVAITAGTGTIISQATVSGITAIVVVQMGIGRIVGFGGVAKQGAILVV